MSHGVNNPDEAPNFKGMSIEIPAKPEHLDDNVEKAVDHVRILLEKYVQEVPFSNPLEGNIADTLPGNESGEMVQKPLSEAKIYLVDDTPEVLRSLGRAMGRHFKNIETFADGKFALEAIYSDGKLVQVPHLVISDTNMKHVHGPQLARAFQEIDPAFRPRFMALTGAFNNENIEDYVKMGLPVLSKPVPLIGNLFAAAAMELRQHPGFRPENK